MVGRVFGRYVYALSTWPRSLMVAYSSSDDTILLLQRQSRY